MAGIGARARRAGSRAYWAAKRAREVTQEEGLAATVQRGRGFLAQRRQRRTKARRPDVPPLTSPAVGNWPDSLVILAAPDIPQCYRYRVQQKQSMARSLGLPLVVADLREPDEARSMIQLGAALIIYRQGWTQDLAEFVAEARRLGQPVIFETDDLIHRRGLVAANPNLATLPEDLRNAVINGSDGYLTALQHADHVIASTRALAADLKREVAGHAFVIENGIDDDILAMLDGIAVDPPVQRWLREHGDEVVITYGSGSRAHDLDLVVASDGLRAVLERHPNVRLKLIGPLQLPDNLKPFSDQVLRADSAPLGDYLRELAMSHVTIAPLQDAPFNQFKSQVKYLEAGLLRLPLVASPTVYGRYVKDGQTALIARNPEDWAEHLESLVVDAQRRRQLTDAAWDHVQEWRLDNRPGRQFAEFAAQIMKARRHP